MYIKGAVILVSLGLAVSDKSPDIKAGTASKDSYENGVGTSFTVPLNPSVAKAVTKNSRKYSVSADDLERADLGVSASYKSSSVLGGAVVDSYSAPVNNLDSLASAKVKSQDVAEARDGAGGHHHHHDAHHAHAEHAAPAVGPQQPSASLQNEYTAPVSTGNLYYYYYPVAAYPLDDKVGQEAEDDELDPLVLVLIPAALLAGFLALVSIFNVSFNRSARSFNTNESWRQNEVFGSWDQLQDKVDNLLENYYAALESESCMDRVVCELGTQANNISGKTLLITALDWFTPTAMRSRIDIFKQAANEGYAPHICKSKYYCDSKNLIEARRK